MNPTDWIGSAADETAKAVTSGIAHFFVDFVGSFVRWAVNGVFDAIFTTTNPDVTAKWYADSWHSMVGLAAVLAVPLFLAGVAQVMIRGEGVPGLVRLLGRLGAAVAGTIVALTCVQLVLSLVDAASNLVQQASGGDIKRAGGHLAELLAAENAAGGPIASTAGAVMLAIVAGVAAFIIWLEMAVRSALVYLAVIFLPLALAGLLWPTTAAWLRRMGEVVGAIAMSKFVIVVTLALSVGALGAIDLSRPENAVKYAVLATAFLILATLGLPIALRLVPLAVAAAEFHGHGGRLVSRTGTRAHGVADRQALRRQLNGSGASRNGSAAGAGGAGAAGGAAAGAAGGAAAGLAMAGSRGARTARDAAGAMTATSDAQRPGADASVSKSSGSSARPGNSRGTAGSPRPAGSWPPSGPPPASGPEGPSRGPGWRRERSTPPPAPPRPQRDER